MRIVAGRFKGRTFATPKGNAIRPTSDRMREALFNILMHGYDDAARDARVLDLFAGTGALGLEALSRGAIFAAFADIGAEARGLLRANVEALGLGGESRILRRDASKLGTRETFEPFTLAFLDPPYGKGLGELALASALAGGWLAPGALVVLEERADAEVTLPDQIARLERRAAGETQLLFGRVKA